jgi:hypothetical protein
VAASNVADGGKESKERVLMQSKLFWQTAGVGAVLAGIGGLLYSVDFTAVVLKWRSSAPELGAFLVVGGLLTTLVFVALYEHLRASESGFATLALVLGAVAALGSAFHGGYDLANAIHPEFLASPGAAAASPDLPSQVDPRGLSTFGLAGAAILLFSWLIVRTGRQVEGRLPQALGYLGCLLGVLLVVIYLGRLIVFHPTPLLAPAAITGLIINPVWYIWLGLALWRFPSAAAK